MRIVSVQVRSAASDRRAESATTQCGDSAERLSLRSCDGGVAAVSLMFDAAEKRLVRAGAADAGGG
jgi:hypothetical protein